MTDRGAKQAPRRLRAHLLGSLEFDAAVRLQRSLAYQLSTRNDTASLILCEHPAQITIGRHGSPAQLRLGPEELASRGWPVRWVSRGGGVVLHLPGQLAVYPVLPLAPTDHAVPAYLAQLHQVFLALLRDFNIPGQTRSDLAGVWAGSRLIVALGVAVRHHVTMFGAWLNVDPDLTLFRLVQSGGPDEGLMTSLARERRAPVRPALVRQRLVEHFREVFGFSDADVLFQGPAELGHSRLVARS